MLPFSDIQVPEESRLVFRAPASSLECCRFISNDEFLSGSDDGSIELWSMLRKKPVYIVKNAHSLLTANKNFEQKDSNRIPNGHLGNYIALEFSVLFNLHSLVARSMLVYTLGDKMFENV